MAVKRIDEYTPDLPAPIPADAQILFEINPGNPATRAYRRGVAATLLAQAGLATASGLTINTAKILGRETAGAGALEEIDLIAGTFLPVATFASPGTLNVSYATQTGVVYKIGRLAIVYINMRFTPTLGTASGEFRITGVPYLPNVNTILAFEMANQPVTWTSATATQACGLLATDGEIRIRDQGSGDSLNTWSTAQVTNAVERDFRLNGVMMTNP